jgi:enamine deaminase RidA (YjgF/YER057c/UK114 family)
MTIKRHGVGPRLSQAVVHGDTVYLAGMVAADPGDDLMLNGASDAPTMIRATSALQ